MFPVFDVSSWAPERPEMLGTKEKGWLTPEGDPSLPSVPHLFKIGRPNTGENWAEKACCEFAKLLQLPCANYHLAFRGNDKGVISERFMPASASFQPGNMILGRMIRGYDVSLRFKQTSYQLGRTIGSLRVLKIQPPLGTADIYHELTSHELFIGYLIFDSLVGNTDRHHENWGVVILRDKGETRYHLGPTFDHASSLGRDQSTEVAARRLATADKRGNVEAYSAKCRSAFFGPGATGKPLMNHEILTELVRAYPHSTKFWAKKVVGLADDALEGVLRRIDPSFISGTAIDFALRMLRYNKNQIKEIVLA